LGDGLATTLPDAPVMLCGDFEKSGDPLALWTGRVDIREEFGLGRGTLFI
jgi:hypothetical protein